MSAKVTLDTKKLDELAATLGVRTAEAIKALAFQVEAQAKISAPYDTGALSNSIYTKTADYDGYKQQPNSSPLPAPRTKHGAVVGAPMDYAAAVELGHLTRPFKKSVGVQRFIPGRPYLRPALESVIQKLNSGELLNALLKGIGK